MKPKTPEEIAAEKEKEQARKAKEMRDKVLA